MSRRFPLGDAFGTFITQRTYEKHAKSNKFPSPSRTKGSILFNGLVHDISEPQQIFSMGPNNFTTYGRRVDQFSSMEMTLVSTDIVRDSKYLQKAEGSKFCPFGGNYTLWISLEKKKHPETGLKNLFLSNAFLVFWGYWKAFAKETKTPILAVHTPQFMVKEISWLNTKK